MLNRSKSDTPCKAVRALQRLPLIGRFVSDERGIAAVEFALVAPVMVAAYLGSVDLTQGVMVDRKVSVMTSAIGDLVAQSEEITTPEINNIFNIANALMAPYDKSTIKLRVSSLEITKKKQGQKREAKVIWSDGKNQSAYAKDTEILVPESIAANATSVIFTEGSYTFTPLFGQIITEKLVLKDSYYHVPRISDSVARK
ncbi:TadE/TadG family type IV pilus assembly protein [Tepidamorphus sp. 3E244]|uniref:TadE/TadG family type IV pilus assembly protein n=1 Tax=Tepidamorphus sp. 3E244 TaxID=3385498 RepID=UPI0038FC4572